MMRALILPWLFFFFSVSSQAFGQSDESVPTPVTLRDPGWAATSAKAASGGRKVALLIGVSRHESKALTPLPFVRKDVAAMQDVLSAPASLGAGFEVITLVDQEVTADAVEARLDRIAESLGGTGNLLLIYYSGHGVVQHQERAYATYYTDLEGDLYTKVLTEGRLAEWITALKAKNDIRVIFIGDACAPAKKVPRRRPKEVTFGDARLYAVPEGHLASMAADRSGSAFTRALVSSLAAMASQPRIHLSELFDHTREAMDLTDRDPGPRLVKEGTDRIFLQDRQQLRFRITAVHGVTGTPLEGARVTLGEKSIGRTPCDAAGLGPGTFRIAVEREGYLRRHAEVPLTPDTSG